jgi:hypothetical protein
MGYNKTTLEQLENDYYELKPYLIALMAGLCFMFKADSLWLLASGILFSAASASIFYMRYFARQHY